MPSPVALVTGATGGIGQAIARRLSAQGMSVVVHSRNAQGAGPALAATLGPNASHVGADLTVAADLGALVDTLRERYGRLDVLVNSAGQSQRIAHDDLRAASPEVWRRLYEINVIAPWQLVTEAESLLRASSTPQRPACVINISSHAGTRARGASIPYAASKAALDHSTRLLARALAPAIRVNAIAPGLVNTPMTADWHDIQAQWRDQAPLQRAAEGEDIADIVAMLAQAHYLTGDIILADGGMHL